MLNVITRGWHDLFLFLVILPTDPLSLCCNHFSQSSDLSDTSLKPLSKEWSKLNHITEPPQRQPRAKALDLSQETIIKIYWGLCLIWLGISNGMLSFRHLFLAFPAVCCIVSLLPLQLLPSKCGNTDSCHFKAALPLPAVPPPCVPLARPTVRSLQRVTTGRN